MCVYWLESNKVITMTGLFKNDLLSILDYGVFFYSWPSNNGKKKQKIGKQKEKKSDGRACAFITHPPSQFSPSSPLLFVVTLTVVCFSSTTVQHSAGHEYLNNESLWTNLEKLEKIFPLSTTPCGHYWLIVVIITVEFYVSFFLFGEIQLFLIK